MKIVTIEEMQAIEKAADKAGVSYDMMMQLAGLATAHHVLRVMDHLELDEPEILILVGPGNNGGDGLVAGTSLASLLEGANVNAYLLKSRDDELVSVARDAGVAIKVAADDKKGKDLRELVAKCDILIDALFGTGARLPIEGEAAQLLKTVYGVFQSIQNNGPHPVVTSAVLPDDPQVGLPYIVAVDCPSGLDCNSGEVDDLTFSANSTVTFGAAKWGQLTFPGANYCGELLIGSIGLEDVNLPELDNVDAELAIGVDIANLLPERPRDSYKGTFGKVLVLAGSSNYIGAPYLCASAAYRTGAGWVSIGAPQIIIPTLASMIPEATWLLLAHEMGVLHENSVSIIRKELDKYNTLLIGPGLGTEDATAKFLKKLLGPTEKEKIKKSRHLGFAAASGVSQDEEDADIIETTLPRLVIDADGLNLLSEIDNWWTLLPEGSVVTPHPGEFARLADIDDEDAVRTVQENRINLAKEHASKWNTVVVLKGAFTTVASPTGKFTILPFATAALAKAGTGDVLAGTIVGLMAQGMDSYDAAVAGGWLHGCAALLAKQDLGTSASVLAGDVMEHLSEALAVTNGLRTQRKRSSE
jgi:hydroxyethylthiazole kinase-like uncharacterized protein yjeF